MSDETLQSIQAALEAQNELLRNIHERMVDVEEHTNSTVSAIEDVLLEMGKQRRK